MADERKRIWVFELYPESMPEHSIEILHSLHVPIAMSPCHDFDKIDVEDVRLHPLHFTDADIGKFKKPHYHLIIAYDGKKSRDNVLDDLEPLGVNFVAPCSCVTSYYRYLCHADDKSKHQYSFRDITTFGGFDPDNYIKDSADVYVPEMMEFLGQHPEMDFAGFCLWCLTHKDEADPDTGEYLNHWEWYLVLTKARTQLFVAFIRSLHGRKKQKGDSDD